MGEGAAMFLFEELEHAKQRGARIYGEISGFGLSSDASHITQPSIDGPARAVRMALAEAKVNPEEVDYINAHGTGTRVNDVTETRVIKEVFGEHAQKLAVSSTKSMHGHVMGATGAVEMAATIQAIDRGVIPPRRITRSQIRSAIWTTCPIKRGKSPCAWQFPIPSPSAG